MANGAYVGVQGIAPDLRPSIQAAQQAARERQAQRQAQKNWNREFEQKERQLDIQEKQAETEQIKAQNAGIKTYLEQNSKWGTEFEKRCLSAKEDISKQPAFLQLANPIFEEIASLREISTTGDFESANKAKAKAEQLYSNLVQLATYCKDYSVAIPQDAFDKSNFAGFTTDLIDGKDTGDWLNGFTDTNWTYYPDQDGGSYISNGAAYIGLNANGDFSIRVGEEEFSSPDALKRYLSNHVIAKDNMLVDEIGELSKLKPQTQETGTDGNIRTVNDIGTFTSSLRTQVGNILSKYPDDYSVEQARKDKDGAMLELFKRYGTDSNVDTVGELKISIVDEYSSKFPKVVKTVTKTSEEEKDNPFSPIPANVNWRDEKSRKNAVAKLRASTSAKDNNTADMIDRFDVIGKAFDQLKNGEGSQTFLNALGYTVKSEGDGKYRFIQATENISDKNFNYQEKENFLVDLTDENSLKSAIAKILTHNNKDHKNQLDVSNAIGIFDFGGYAKDDTAKRVSSFDYALQQIKNAGAISNTKKIDGIAAHDFIKNAITAYLPKDSEIEETERGGWGNNDITYTVKVPDGKDEVGNQKYITKTYTVNTNVEDDDVNDDDYTIRPSAIFKQIKADFPISDKSATIFKQSNSTGASGGSSIIGQNPFAFDNQNTVVTTETLNL